MDASVPLPGMFFTLLSILAPRFLLGQVFQPRELTYTEGDKILIPCHQNASGHNTMHWYKQSTDGVPSWLGQGYEGSSPAGDYQVEVIKSSRSTSLTKDVARLRDGGVYFCALGGTGGLGKPTFGTGTKLFILPDIEDSEPSVYKLKPRKGDNENLSACLITDYSPGNILAGLNGSLESISSSFVITSYGASYGTVVWDDMPGNFSCSASHKGKTYSDLTEDADGPPVEEFETDERLNFISITVLGLRVIFLKSVAINLLLTFRLWSC